MSDSLPSEAIPPLPAGSVAPPGAILVVAPQPFFVDRGTPIAVMHVVESLCALGWAVDVLTFPLGRSPEIANLRYLRVPNHLGFDEVPIGFSMKKLWLDLFLWRDLRRALHRREYAAVHAVEEGAFMAVLEARRHGVPVVYDMQSSLAEQLHDHRLFRSRPMRRLVDACERWLLHNADRIACSTGLEERVTQQAPSAQVRQWTFPGTWDQGAGAARDTLRAALGIEPEQSVVLYTGNFADYQGVPDLVDAVGLVREAEPDAVFLLVGAAEDRNGIARRLTERVPARAYRLIPRQPASEVPSFLAAADIVVSPRSYGSNLPLKVLEYLAAGRAIVATDIPAHTSVLTRENAQLVEPGPAGLARGIVELLRDPERRAGLEAAARAYADEHLGRDAFLLQIAALYRDLVPRERPR